MIDFEIDTKKIIDNIKKLEKNILIYPHKEFNNNDGGISVQYYLANVLSKLGVNVQIYNVYDKNSHNSIYNNFIDNIKNVNFDNTIVIYCEGVVGNPLRAKYVVRWMLSKLGQNVPYHHYDSWGKNELVYFFNSEKEMVNKNVQFKLLSLFYFDTNIKNHNLERKGLCYTIRKKTQFSHNIDINEINSLFNLPIFEITRSHNQNDYIDIFNNHEYFISYDPLTFLNIIAILCGCVSIVYPINGVSKIEYFKMTPFYQYMVEKNIFEIYGLAYGINDEEINYSKNTLHLAKNQMIDIQNWFVHKYVQQFLNDLNIWDKNYNILKYYKYSMCENIPVFDVDFYRSVHNDLKDFPNERIINHFYHYGINEKRLASEKHFYILYPEFDADFYKYFYEDLKNHSNKELLSHYYYFGNNEKRITSTNNFYEIYPYFDPNFYRFIYSDLQNLNDIKLMNHYYNYGVKEGRIASEKYFYFLYPNFDINYYKSFNIDLKDMTNEELIKHFINVGLIINKKYFDYDFIIEDNYSFSIQNKKNNYNDTSFRTIDNYGKLQNFFKQYEKKYYIYNKESFYTYYYDFDYDYYKNIYFKHDNKIKEDDILLYYHLIGKYKKHCINNKITIIMYSPIFNEKCGGIIVMHYFCKLINEKYNDKFCAKLFMCNNLKYKNPFCNYFARIDEINDNSLVIYPEIVIGNPLNAKNVVRWILLELGIEMTLDHYKNWSESDLIYHWENIDKQLSCPFYNNIFTNKNLENRNKTCFLIKKGSLIHKNINYIHPQDSICIDDLSLEEKANIFNNCKFFYTYDPNSAYIIFAAACGCIPIIYELEGVNEEDYFKSKIFNFENKIYNKGIVYGNNVEKINYILKNKLNENNKKYYKNLFAMIEEKTIPMFLNDVENIYYKLSNDYNLLTNFNNDFNNIYDMHKIYKSFYNKFTDSKEKLYYNDLNISDILKKLDDNNIKILILNGDYSEASGGITVLHYFCHILNYTANKNIAYLVKNCNKNIKYYTDKEDFNLITNPNYITPCVTPEILHNKNNIVIYMDSIKGNPLEQKYVMRWVLYFELSERIRTWDKNDIIIWYIDTYQKYSKHVQKVNNEKPINYQEIPNKQFIMPILSNISKILSFGKNGKNTAKKGICFTTRKAGYEINPDRRLRKINIIGNLCKNCINRKWPCICECKDYTNGVKLLHNEENLVYRFEYPINLDDEVKLFANMEKFYMYDPFCFSAVIAVLNNCLTIVPKLDSFENDNPYENVPWMQYGISYGIDEKNIKNAKKTIKNAEKNLTETFYNLNYDSLKIFYNIINELF
jgi:hypothetical protein